MVHKDDYLSTLSDIIIVQFQSYCIWRGWQL